MELLMPQMLKCYDTYCKISYNVLLPCLKPVHYFTTIPGGGAVVVAVGVVPNENPVAAGVAAGAAPNENPDPVDDAGLEAPKENPPMAGVGAAPGAVVVGAAAGDPKENAPVGLDAPPNPPNPDIFLSKDPEKCNCGELFIFGGRYRDEKIFFVNTIGQFRIRI